MEEEEEVDEGDEAFDAVLFDFKEDEREGMVMGGVVARVCNQSV